MALKLEHLEYHCMGKGKNKNFFASVIVSNNQKDLSGVGENMYTSENAAWHAVMIALSPLNIIDTEKLENVKVLPGEPMGIVVSYSYNGKRVTGYSRNPDRTTAVAEALVDACEKIMAQT